MTLLWRRGEGAVALSVYDSRTNASFAGAVPPARAAAAFCHPFAYLGPSRAVTLPGLAAGRARGAPGFDLDVQIQRIGEPAAEMRAGQSPNVDPPGARPGRTGTARPRRP